MVFHICMCLYVRSSMRELARIEKIVKKICSRLIEYFTLHFFSLSLMTVIQGLVIKLTALRAGELIFIIC